MQTETIDKLLSYKGLLCKNKGRLYFWPFHSLLTRDNGYIAVSIDDKMEMPRRMGSVKAEAYCSKWKQGKKFFGNLPDLLLIASTLVTYYS